MEQRWRPPRITRKLAGRDTANAGRGRQAASHVAVAKHNRRVTDRMQAEEIECCQRVGARKNDYKGNMEMY
uniref:Uncharacterized protein n=1 Tax=Oryza barthii TaxID=65489 RepID=A0A0D3GI41_9ORYZ